MEDRRTLATLDYIRIDGTPRRERVRTREARGPSEVQRREQSRVVPVLADVAGGGVGRAVTDMTAALAAVPAPPGLRVEIGGENEEMRRSFRDLAFAFGLALFLVYMILAAKFESFIHPFTILLSVPLALIGAITALWFAGGGLNTMSLIGMVILVGIVVNDAIIKVDFINQARARGRALRDAILEAGQARLRPILMTTATTVLGLTPMALGMGAGADLRAPLAIAVIGGLIVATGLTLIVIPVAYDLIESVRVRLRALFGRPVEEPALHGTPAQAPVPAGAGGREAAEAGRLAPAGGSD
jgi:hydrophobic/amphiphilic exporter-1 (mainly G- bacteria), HAE1 family